MPPNVYLKNKIEERTSQAQVLTNLQQTAAENSRDLTEDERKTYDSIVARLQFLDQEIERIAKAEEGAAKFVEIYGAHKEAQERARAAHERERADRFERPPEQRTVKTWGQRFTESEVFRSFGGHGTSSPFRITQQNWVEERADLSGNGGNPITSGMFADENGIPRPAQLVPSPTPPSFVTPLYDVIGRQPTTMGSVEYYYWHPDDSETSVAGEVAEGDLKPEADIEGELKAVPVKTYAWWKGITRQGLEDIPGVQSIVDGYLRRGVMRRIERAAVAELTGSSDISNVSEEMLAGIRVGMAQVQDQGYVPNAVLLNPFDFASLDVTLLGRTLNGPVVGTNFWGIIPVPSSGVPAGTAFVGDFQEAITFYDRSQVDVIMTDSHSDWFLRNKLVLLAEARGVVVLTNSAAVVEVTGTAGNGNGDLRRTRKSAPATPPPTPPAGK